jgi:hypothetical protein
MNDIMAHFVTASKKARLNSTAKEAFSGHLLGRPS